MAGEEPIVSGMAGRYATAVFELAREEKTLDEVMADLDRFDPVFGAEEQQAALVAVLDRAGIGATTANFLRLVTANRRLFAVRDMIRGLRVLVARHKGEVTAHVTVAERLADRHLAALKDALKSVTGKDVTLDIKVEPAIIGGLVVKVGSRMVDASLKTKLNSIRHAMKEVG